jgi:hypothetical protein
MTIPTLDIYEYLLFSRGEWVQQRISKETFEMLKEKMTARITLKTGMYLIVLQEGEREVYTTGAAQATAEQSIYNSTIFKEINKFYFKVI